MDRDRQSRKYTKATSSHTSKSSPLELAISDPTKVSSWMEMSETMEESFTREMYWPVSGGAMRASAWGKMTNR